MLPSVSPAYYIARLPFPAIRYRNKLHLTSPTICLFLHKHMCMIRHLDFLINEKSMVEYWPVTCSQHRMLFPRTGVTSRKAVQILARAKNQHLELILQPRVNPYGQRCIRVAYHTDKVQLGRIACLEVGRSLLCES